MYYVYCIFFAYTVYIDNKGHGMGNVLTPEEAAAEWRLESHVVRRWIREGKLKAIKLGNQWRIKREDWDAFIKAAEEGEPKKANGLAFSH